MISEILLFFEDLLFPTKCGGCNIPGSILCQNCIYTFEKSDQNFEKNIDSLFDYRKGLLKKLVWKVKYKNDRKLAESLGELLANYILEEIDSIKKLHGGEFITVCIPNRQKGFRVFNHAEILAKSVSTKNNLESLLISISIYL